MLHITSWKSILILFSHLSLDLPSGLLPSRFPLKHCMKLSYMCYIFLPSHSSRLYDPNNIWWRDHIIKLFSVQPSPVPYYLLTVRPKYLRQPPILRHFQPLLNKADQHRLTSLSITIDGNRGNIRVQSSKLSVGLHLQHQQLFFCRH